MSEVKEKFKDKFYKKFSLYTCLITVFVCMLFTIPSPCLLIKKKYFLNNAKSIKVDLNNQFYYSKGNCLIEKSSDAIVLGCKNSIIPKNVTYIYEYAFKDL